MSNDPVAGLRQDPDAAPPAGTLRARVHCWLADDETDHRIARALRRLLAAVILVSVAVAILDTLPDLPAALRSAFALAEAGFLLLFTTEYGLRLWTIVEDRSGRFADPLYGRLRWAVTPLALVDLLAVLPFWLGLATGGEAVVLRLFRVLRLLKLARHSRTLSTFELVLLNERRALATVFAIMAALLTIAAAALHVLEAEVQPQAFGSIPASMWWAVATLTTVGYGDVVPVTPAGRFVAALLAFLGIGMFALPTAILGAAFIQELQKQNFARTAFLVARVPLFRRLDAARIAELTALLRVRELPAGYTLIRPGERGEGMYFLAEGRVAVHRGSHRHLLEPGAFFGELALLDGRPRTAAVTTITPCRVLELPAADFHRLLAGDPQLRDAILAEIRHRMAADTVSDAAGADHQPRASSGTNGRSAGPV